MPVTRYTFGDAELDPAAYRLRLRGAPVQVEPRVLEMLVYLIRHRDRLVTKDELLQQIWPSKYVTESVLTRAIYEARRAVDDDSRRQCVIKTVHSRGYQFVAAVEEVVIAEEAVIVEQAATAAVREDADADNASSASLPEPLPPRTAPARRSRFIPAIGIAAAAAIIAALLWFWRPVGPVERERVAIAPFGVEAETQDLDWGELALPSLLADVLRERTDVVVFPANRVRQSLQQRGLDTDATEQEQILAMRDVFGVDHVLFGRVGRENGRMHVDYHLVSVDGSHRTGRASGDGPGSLTTQLAESVARRLDVAYAAGIPARKISPNEFINEAFARGLNALLGGHLADALRYFETCLASEPANGWARYEAGNVMFLLGHWEDATDAFVHARRNADADGDDNLAGATAAGLGTLAWRRGRLDEAEGYFETARAHFTATNRRGNLAGAVGNLGILADNRGDLQLARERYEMSLTLFRDEGERPGESATYSNLAVIERKLGRLDAAAQLQQRAIDLQRQVGLREMLVFSLTHLGEIERGRGRWQDAQPLLDEAVALAQETGYRLGHAEALTARGALAIDLGRRDAAGTDLRAARAIYADLDNPAGDARSALQLASLLSKSGPHEARELARRAVAEAERLGDEALALEAKLALLELGVGDPARLLPRVQMLGNHRLLAMSWAARSRREGNPVHLRTALAHAESAGDRRLQAEIAVELGRMLLEQGQADGIEPLLGRAAAWKSDFAPALALRACHLAYSRRPADAERVLHQARSLLASQSEPDIGWCPHWR